MATNLEMSKVPELIANAVHFYLYTKNDVYEMAYTLKSLYEALIERKEFDSAAWEHWLKAYESRGDQYEYSDTFDSTQCME